MVISGARRCSASATRRCTRDMLGDSHPIEASCDYADHDAGAPSQLQTNGSIHLPAQEQPKPHLVSKKKQASGAAAAVSNSQHTVVSPCDEGTLQHIKKLGKGAEAKVTWVKYGDVEVAFKKFFRRTGASGAAAVAQDATAEFNALATAYAEAKRTANGAQHLNVVRPITLVIDGANGGNITGFLMERLEGRCLLHYLSRSPAWNGAQPSTHPPLTLQAAACIGMQACHGVAAYNRAKMKHGDVKPNNFVLRTPVPSLNDVTPGVGVVLLDGGLAAESSSTPERCVDAEGTPAFMAPEQLCAAPGATFTRSPAIDSRALGCTLLCLYGTQLPTEGLSERAVIAATVDGSLMSELFPQFTLPGPAVIVNVALWLADDVPQERLSAEQAAKIFSYIYDGATCGLEFTVADVQAAYGLAPHRLLHLYPTTGDSPGGSSRALSNSDSDPAALNHSAALGSLGEASLPAAGHDRGAAEAALEAAPARACGPSFAGLVPVKTGDFADMAALLRCSSWGGECGRGAGRRSKGAHMIYAAASGEGEADERVTGGSTGAASGLVRGGSPRITAFGERMTAHSFAAADVDQDGRTKASGRGEAVGEVERQGKSQGLLGSMGRVWGLCAASFAKLSAAVCCRSTAVMVMD